MKNIIGSIYGDIHIDFIPVPCANLKTKKPTRFFALWKIFKTALARMNSNPSQRLLFTPSSIF
ncbi:MAG: hypothetical protein ACOX4O_13050 [Eubacteriales bacterium]